VTDRYAVIGNPVAHSKSPWIHARFAEQTGQDIAYGSVLAPLDGFGATVVELRSSGAKGANVTLPFKEEAFRLCSELSERARVAKAVNTLIFAGSTICGDNTDGCGLTRDLTVNLQFTIEGRSVLLLGAGGAARGVLLPLLDERPASLTIANRTVDKARALVGELQTVRQTEVTACGFSELTGRSFDLVINATSAGLSAAPLSLPAHLYRSDALAYDMVYGRETAFLAQAAADGASRTSDGLGMLVEQAAESFYLWRGVRPLTAPVMAALRAA
jgi:shikimate dehydrogenase